MKLLMLIAAMLAFILSGCSAQSAPAIDPTIVQAVTVAAAQEMFTLTQTAIPPTIAPSATSQPTSTTLPSQTDTPLPTLSTSSDTTTPVLSVGSGTGNPCNSVLGSNPPGPKANIILWNETPGPITVSITVSKTKFGQCGYRSYALNKGASVNLTDIPLSCYSIYAWINDPKKPTHATGGGCWNNTDRLEIVVTTAKVKLTVTHP